MINLALEGAQEKPNDQKTEKVAPENKCEEVIPLKHLPTKPKQKPSLEEPLALERKPLPDHVEDAFLGENKTLLVIITKSLIGTQKERLMEVLGRHKLSLGGQQSTYEGLVGLQ